MDDRGGVIHPSIRQCGGNGNPVGAYYCLRAGRSERILDGDQNLGRTGPSCRRARPIPAIAPNLALFDLHTMEDAAI